MNNIFNWKSFNENNNGDNNIIDGEKIAEYYKDITPDDDIVDSLASLLTKRSFIRVDDYDIKSLLSDRYFKEYYDNVTNSGEFRYEEYDEYEYEFDVNEDTLVDPVIVVDGELQDGWSRTTQLINSGEKTIIAYVAV